jgi:hypothetical protein
VFIGALGDALKLVTEFVISRRAAVEQDRNSH